MHNYMYNSLIPCLYIRAANVFGRHSVQLHVTASAMGVSMEDFSNAKEKLSKLKTDPGNEVKLKIYALFKQVRPRCTF